MLFQTLDDKQECVGVYIDGEIYYGDVPEGLTGTWSYAPYLDGRDIDYAGLFCGGLDCGHVCPEALKDQWEEKTDKLKAFLRSFQESKVDLHENCFFELVPSRFLLEYCELKNKITQHVLDNYPKPKNYDFMLGITKLANQLRNQKVNLDLSSLNGEMSHDNGRRSWLLYLLIYIIIYTGQKQAVLQQRETAFQFLLSQKSFEK